MDWYTLAHAMVGIFLGAWFMPLAWVLLLTITWEIFEKFAPGFGETETMANRIVDVTAACLGWVAVTGGAAFLQHATVPLIISQTSILCSWVGC
jgi:hypothetical protein